MEDLPQLDIEEDLEALASDDDMNEPPMQDLSKPIEASKPNEIFMPPTNNKKSEEPVEEKVIEEPPVQLTKSGRPKRPRTQKQIDHLNRVRKKAVDKMKQKKQDRLESEKLAKELIKQKRAKEKADKLKDKAKDLVKDQPSEEEIREQKRLKDEEQFGMFVANMEKFERMRYEYHEKNKPKPTPPPAPKPTPKPTPCATPPPPAISLIQNPTNPYASAFNW